MTTEIDPRTLDVLALDGRLRRLARRWRSFRRAIRQAEGLEDEPFADSDELARRSLFHALAELERAGDPIAASMRRWVYRLTEQRIDQSLLVTIERARRVDVIGIQAPEQTRTTRRDLLLRALREPKRRALWLDATMDNAGPLPDLCAELWQRRREVALGMGLEDADQIEAPCAGLAALAEGWLSSSADVAAELGVRDVSGWVGAALGVEANDDWPRRIDARSLSELWSDTRLLDSLELDPGRFPQPLGASSWLRALARLGSAFTDAAAPAHQPFCVAHDPYGLRRRTFGALFAMVALCMPFLQRRLGLGRDRARAHARALSITLFFESRSAGLRVRLRPPALRGKSAHLAAFEAETERWLGRPLPGRAVGSIFRLHADDGQRFAGLLLAADRARALTEAHDEDWFRNPRAAEELRAEADLSPEPHARPAELERGAAELEKIVRHAVG